MSSLVGKWAFFSDVEYYKFGSIEENIDGALFLVKILHLEESKNPVSNKMYEVISLHKFLHTLNPDVDWTGINIFDTKEDLLEYVKWIQSPCECKNETGEKVVPFKSNK